MRRVPTPFLALAVALVGSPGAGAFEPPVAVSPGSETGAPAEGSCPVFIWGGEPGVETYELVVYRVEPETARPSVPPGSEATLELRRRLPGSVDTWTPSLDSCLDRGARYAWSVRSVAEDGASEWSSPRLFRVPPGPTGEELDRALSVVRDSLREHGAEGGDRTPPARPETAQPGAADTALPTAPAPSALAPRSHAGTGGGIVVDGVAAETQADPPCYPDEGDPDAEDRFIDCGNGTVLDTTTGLLWLEDANCPAGSTGENDDGKRTWYEANAFAAGLARGQCGLTDHSQPGDWRLPTTEEWESILKGSCPTDPEVVGKAAGCYSDEPWAVGVEADAYWASTSRPDAPEIAETGALDDGFVAEGFKNAVVFVWPVRDAQ